MWSGHTVRPRDFPLKTVLLGATAWGKTVAVRVVGKRHRLEGFLFQYFRIGLKFLPKAKGR